MTLASLARRGVAAALLTVATMSAAPAQERTMVIGMTGTPRGLDPDVWLPGMIEAIANVYEGLTRYAVRANASGKLEAVGDEAQPHFAESWTVSPDGKEFVFKLKPGVRSPYGNELTSDDILWSYDRAEAIGRTGKFMKTVSRIAKVEALSRYEVKITLNTANRILISVLGTYVPAIFDTTEVKKHITDDDKWASKWIAQNTAGFGPYHLQSMQAGQQAVFVVNPNYAFDKPHFSRVVWREVPAAATRVALIRTGQIHYAEQIPLQQIVDLKRDRQVKVESVAGTGSATLRLNPKFPPFDDQRVRHAVAYAIDYKAIGEAVFLGLGTRSRSLLSAPIPGAIDAYLYETDYDKAKQLLAAAGHANGIDVTIEYSTNWWWEEPLVLQAQQSLARAGIRATPKRIPTTEMNARRAPNQHTLPFMTHLTSAFVPDPSYAMFLTAHSRGSSNVNANSSAELDRLIDESIGERDQAKWLQLVGNAQRVQAEYATFIETFLPGTHEVFAACIDGFLWRPLNRLYWKDLVCK
jgi:ABC-type transport system substrate-binding protein